MEPLFISSKIEKKFTGGKKKISRKSNKKKTSKKVTKKQTKKSTKKVKGKKIV